MELTKNEVAEKSVTVTRARVNSARVYTNGCVLTCADSVDLAVGVNTVLVDCVARGLVEDSIRVRVPAHVSLLSVGVVHQESDRQATNERITDLERELACIDAKVQNRSSQKELWTALARPKDVSVGNLDDLQRYLQDLPIRLDSLDNELSELTLKREDVVKKLELSREALAQEMERDQRGLLCLRLVATKAGPIRFEVEYRSTLASWKPVYDVLVEKLEGPLSLRLRAEVNQSTGIDWQDVTLALSTATPSLGKGVPRLFPVRIRKQANALAFSMNEVSAKTRNLSLSISAPRAVSDTMAFDDANSEQMIAETMPIQATADEHAISMEFTAPGTWSIESESDSALVEIQTIVLETIYERRAIPSADDAVFLIAILKDPLPSEAIGNSASVYIEGEYCGRVQLDEPDDNTFEISLGPDTRMHTSRRLIKRYTANTILRGRRSETTAFELEVASHRDEEVRVKLVDQVPISEDKDIVVEIREDGGAKHNDETGELRWEFTLLPHSNLKRRFSYTVSHPKDVRVTSTRSEALRVPSRVICKNCGAVISPEDLFCACCGSPTR